VLATDISTIALKTARTASYAAGRMQGVEKSYIDKYFRLEADGRYQVSEALRKRVCFSRMNILDAGLEQLGKMDLIYCQNMLIYFGRAVRNKLVDSMVEHLLPGGLLVLGSGELVGWKHPYMEKIKCEHALAYRRAC
jgi:type IV pilus assembly protein PilK